MYEIKQSYLIQLENEELRKRITELRNEVKELKERINQVKTANSRGNEAGIGKDS